MSAEAFSFFLFTILAVAVQGFFALFEMAAVSFNKIRLQYAASLGKKRAVWLDSLLRRPSRLFIPTLLGVNTALQVGSECSRRFYESIHLDPDWAPISQVILVVIFGELVPMFTARRHPEKLALGLVPLMALISFVLRPIVYCFDALIHLFQRITKKRVEAPSVFSREEIRMTFEERESQENERNRVVRQIFLMKNRTAEHLMTPLSQILMIPSTASLSDVKRVLGARMETYLPIYHRTLHNIIGILHLRDILKLSESKKITDEAKSPWFVSKDTLLIEMLNQFRRNNQAIAVILDESGKAMGVVAFDQILSEIFGVEIRKPQGIEKSHLYIERTLPGDMPIEEFNRKFRADFPHLPEETLEDLILKEQGHFPLLGEEVVISAFSFEVKELKLNGIKAVVVRTQQG